MTDPQPQIQVICNGQPRSISPGASIAALLVELGLPQKYVAVELNRQLIPRGQHSQHLLTDGDHLEVVTLVGGG